MIRNCCTRDWVYYWHATMFYVKIIRTCTVRRRGTVFQQILQHQYSCFICLIHLSSYCIDCFLCYYVWLEEWYLLGIWFKSDDEGFYHWIKLLGYSYWLFHPLNWLWFPWLISLRCFKVRSWVFTQNARVSWICWCWDQRWLKILFSTLYCWVFTLCSCL